MTFGRPRYNRTVQWELLRLATRSNTQIIGGTQKLWKYFLNKYQPNTVISYCDKRWFTGKIYEILGFVKRTDGKPTYWYTDYVNRYHRSRYTKKLSVKAAMNHPGNQLSESELMLLTENQITKGILGLDRIWDCGQDSWVWKKLE